MEIKEKIQTVTLGGTQSGLRDQNARLVLSMIRRHGALSGAEIARRSSLTAQTVSNIVRALESDGVLKREAAIKGKVGKPSTPVSLNPKGVHSLGLSIGRRSAELVLVDFTGRSLAQRAIAYSYPVIETVFAFLKESTKDILAAHPQARSTLAGIGVGRPFEIWSWLEVVDAPERLMRAWQDIDLGASIEQAVGLSATLQNDATSACVAEHLLGRGHALSNFAYIFVGAFVGGGLVLDNKVVTGPNGNAAAFGAMRMPDGRGGTTQLLQVASLHVLERALRDANVDIGRLRDARDDWSTYAQWVEPWLVQTSHQLAIASINAATVVEVEAILIDGAMPATVRADLVNRTREHIRQYTLTGIAMPDIQEAVVGRNARSIGAALLPIHSKYFLA
ncbi:MAG: ROK family transcriptional regulator [Pseudomonadota bacterium]